MFRAPEEYLGQAASTVSLAEAASAAASWLLAEDIHNRQDAFSEVAARLGAAVRASRAYLFGIHSDAEGNFHAHQVAVWHAPGGPARIDAPELQDMLESAECFPHLEACLGQGHAYAMAISQAQPAERAFLECQGIRSLLLVPLRNGDLTVGAIGFDDRATERVWDTTVVDCLGAAITALLQTQGRERAMLAQRDAEAHYRSIFENAVAGIYQTNLDGRYLNANPMLAEIYGYESPTALLAAISNVGTQLYVDPSRRQEFIRAITVTGSLRGFESQVRCRDGSIIWISECARVLYDPDGNPTGYEGTVENITCRKQAETELQRQERLLAGVARVASLLLREPNLDAAIPEVLAHLGEAADADRAYVYENHPGDRPGETCMSMRFEWTRPGCAPTIDKPHWQNLSYQSHGLQRWYATFLAGEPVSGCTRTLPAAEQELLQRDDIRSIFMVPIVVADRLWGYVGFDACREERQWLEGEASSLVTAAASLGGAVERQQTEERMREHAYHDALTGLPNRTALQENLTAAIARAESADGRLAAIFLDLDGFKIVNDSLGHHAGDRLLGQLARRFRANIPAEATIARWGGDEFVCLLPMVVDAVAAKAVAADLLTAIDPTFELDGERINLTGSAGVALYPEDGRDYETLLQNADSALYAAKRRGRRQIATFTPQLNVQATERLQLESQFYRALEVGEFVAYYQPIVKATTGTTVGMEALIRWQHPELGLVLPGRFIALAEENGSIVRLGEWMLATACQQYADWQSQGIAPDYIAANLSPRQLQDPDLLGRLQAIVAAAGIPPHCLQLEITETGAMQSLQNTQAFLEKCRAFGMRVALDDFGTGYASLNHLRRFPLDALKIDRSFVANMATNAADAAIVETILTLGRGLQLHAIAEGVETAAQRDCLVALGCEEVQGFFYSKPLEPSAATVLLQSTARMRSNLCAPH